MTDAPQRRFTKADVLVIFQRQDHAYQLALLASQLLRSQNNSQGTVSATARGSQTGFGSHWISGAELAAKLDSEERDGLWSEFTLVQLHALIQFPLEVLEDYCEDAKQLAALAATDWYRFAKHIRNAVAHNRRFHFGRNNEGRFKHLPASWEGQEITEDMQGKPLTFEHLWHQNGYRLFVAMRAFLESLPEPPLDSRCLPHSEQKHAEASLSGDRI
ncbi:MAG: hypothetical protein HYR63_20555 [Proteobacteria bacterium]|nr:hypothetical protein [Pseudomonadota bacterium]MBI3497133.1 hypothetical protein [Pseudomonadota bacterium]